MARSRSRTRDSLEESPEVDVAPSTPEGRDPSTMIPARRQRRGIESVFVRLVATAGIIGIGVVLGAILVSSKVDGWIVGLAVALTCVILSAVLWSSRQV